MLLLDRPTGVQPSAATGPEQGVIEEARRRQRTRRIRATIVMALVTVGVGVLIASSAGGPPSAEPSLHLPPEPNELPRAVSSSGHAGVSVRLTPDIEGGQAGWCVEVLYKSGGGGGTCPPLPTLKHPLLSTGTGWTRGEPDAITVVLTAPRVAYMLVNSAHRIPTVAFPGLPYGLRVAVVHTPYRPTQTAPMRIPKLIPLDSHGKRIVESPDYGSGLPTRDWNPPSAPSKGACALHAQGLPGLKTEWGQVATAIRPYAGQIVGRGFLSCIDTEYFLPGRGLRAAVLLDAAAPGRVPPAEIPGLAAIPQAPGFYNGSGDPRDGPMTAKRQGNAWIVVAGGGRNAEETRIRLLRHLTATLSPGKS